MPLSAMLDDGFIFESLLDSTGDSVYVKDRRCRLLRVSRSMARNLGFASPEDLVGKSDLELFGSEFAQRTYLEDLTIMETDQPVSGIVESRQLPDGSLNWTLTSKLPLHDRAGNVVGLIGITREINELKQAETTLQYLATHDSLTTLPNRYLVMDRLSQLLARSERAQAPFAVLFADIDNFKRMNDSLGHAAGDDLLRSIARRLQASVRGSDSVARIGGDEFVILVEGVDCSGAILVAEKVRKAVSAAVMVQGRRTKVTVSVGIALYPDHGRTGNSLITAADHAMYLAKNSGKNRYLVCPSGASDMAGFLAQSA
jgi:diguanylate cyclase (GGDEF)-like protein/PAS domain S-box-containing protein